MLQQVIRKYDDVAADFPENGIFIPDVAGYLFEIPTDASLTVYITMDRSSRIADGTADWVEYKTFTDNTLGYFEYGPTGVKLVATGSVKAWFKV